MPCCQELHVYVRDLESIGPCSSVLAIAQNTTAHGSRLSKSRSSLDSASNLHVHIYRLPRIGIE